MKRRWTAGVGVAAAALALGACGSSGGGASTASNGPPAVGHGGKSVSLASAYTKTIDAKSAKMTMTAAITVNGTPVTTTSSGEFDWSKRLGQITTSVKSPASSAANITLTEILDGTSVYVQVPPQAAGALGGGKPWIRVDVPKVGSSNSAGDPAQTLATLEASSTGLQDLGQEQIGGVATTHYRAQVDPAKEAANAPASIKALIQGLGTTSFPMDVWVDGQGLPRQMQFSVTVTPPSGSGLAASGPLTVKTTMDLSDFGVPVTVTPPPADQVSTQSLGGLFGSGSSGSSGT